MGSKRVGVGRKLSDFVAPSASALDSRSPEKGDRACLIVLSAFAFAACTQDEGNSCHDDPTRARQKKKRSNPSDTARHLLGGSELGSRRASDSLAGSSVLVHSLRHGNEAIQSVRMADSSFELS